MTLQQIRYFLAVANYKNFSRAAESLFVSQPALSKQIALIEKSLGFPLFERTSRNVELTGRGKQLYERLQPVIRQLDSIFDDFLQPSELRIGTLPSIASFYLPSVIPRITSHRLIPVVRDTSDVLLEMVAAGELDAAIVQDRSQFGALKQKLLFEEPYIAALPEGHSLASRERLELDEVLREKIILHQPPCDITDALLEVFHRSGQPLDVSMDVHLNDSLLSYTAAGAGITFIPAMMAHNVTRKNIVYRPIQQEVCKRQIFLFARAKWVLDVFELSEMEEAQKTESGC